MQYRNTKICIFHVIVIKQGIFWTIYNYHISKTSQICVPQMKSSYYIRFIWQGNGTEQETLFPPLPFTEMCFAVCLWALIDISCSCTRVYWHCTGRRNPSHHTNCNSVYCPPPPSAMLTQDDQLNGFLFFFLRPLPFIRPPPHSIPMGEQALHCKA